MILSSVAGDLEAGTVNMPDGTIKYNKIGCYVLSTDEAEAIMIRKRQI